MDQSTQPEFEFHKVQDAKRPEIQEKLLEFTANKQETLDWYYANDPLSQDLNILTAKIICGDYGADGKNIQEYFNALTLYPSYYEHAGLTLLANIVDPEITEDPDTPWSEKLPVDFKKSTLPALGNEVVAYPLLANLPKNMTHEQLVQAFIALDCLRYTGTAFFAAQNNIAEGNLTELISPHDLATIRSKAQIYPDVSFQLATIITMQANDKKTEKDPVTQKICLQANQYISTTLLSHANTTHFPEDMLSLDQLKLTTNLHAFKNLIDGISSFYLDPNFSENKVIKGEDKGLLHETIWLLDMNFLLLTDKKIKNAYVVPTFPRVDSPKIGRPKYNRAYDVHIQFGNTGRTLPVQLKSSNNAAKNAQYHPNIDVVVENNFADVDKRRLSAKLAKYTAWVESGLSEEAAAQLQKYILPSARKYLERVYEIDALDEAEYFLSKISTAGLDRAAKRRIARAIRKKAT